MRVTLAQCGWFHMYEYLPQLFHEVRLWNWHKTLDRSSHRRCSIQKVNLKHFAIFTGKHQCWNLLLIKLEAFGHATILKTDSKTGVFLWILRNFCCNTYLIEHLRLLLRWKMRCGAYWNFIDKAEFLNKNCKTQVLMVNSFC